MIRRKGELRRGEKANLRGGRGTIIFDDILEAENNEFYGKGRMFAITTVKPGDSIGYHVHEGDMEVYHILSGEGLYDDNGAEKILLKEGDTTITMDGEGHGIENNSDKDLVFIALILFSK